MPKPTLDHSKTPEICAHVYKLFARHRDELGKGDIRDSILAELTAIITQVRLDTRDTIMNQFEDMMHEQLDIENFNRLRGR